MKLSNVVFSLAIAFIATNGILPSDADGASSPLDWSQLIPSHIGQYPVKTATVNLNNNVVLNLAFVNINQQTFQTNYVFGALVGANQENIATNSVGPIQIKNDNFVGRKMLGTDGPADFEDVSRDSRTLLDSPRRSPNFLSLKFGNTDVVNLAKINLSQSNTQSNSAGLALYSGQSNYAVNQAGGTTVEVNNLIF